MTSGLPGDWGRSFTTAPCKWGTRKIRALRLPLQPTPNSLTCFESTETLEKYVGVYVSPPARFTITRKDSTLYVQSASESTPAPLEAKSDTVFQVTNGVSMEFNGEKGEMTLKRPQGERVFTREK